MPETLLTPTGVKLFGRVETSLQPVQQPVIGNNPGATGNLGANNFLANQLNAANAQFARIYGFAYEGHYYDLPKPALFLVHGQGTSVDVGQGDRTPVDVAGVVAKEWEFDNAPNGVGRGNSDLRMWEYDKGDFSLRLDIESGPFEQILLAACLRGGPAYSSGSDLRMSGSDLRMSGSDLRRR